MRILAFSDWRIQNIDKLIEYLEGACRKPDIIVYAGDDISRFNRVSVKEIPKTLRKIYSMKDFPSKNYFEKLAAFSKYGLIAVAGNDDFPFTTNAICGKNVYNIHETPLVLEDYAFIGVEGSTTGPGILLHSEEDVKKHLSRMAHQFSDRKIVLVSHTPPFGILDIGIRFGIDHIGSRSLRRFIDQYNDEIRLLICGHAHSQGGKQKTYKKVTVLNCASHDNEGEPGKVAIVEIDGNIEVAWTFIFEWGVTQKEIEELMDIPLVGHSRATAFFDMGIRSIKEVAKIDPSDKSFQRHNCFSTSCLELIKNYASAIAKNRIVVKGKHPFFDSTNRLYFFDAEYSPTGTKDGPFGIFLLGIMDESGNVIQHFLDVPEREKRILEQFRKWLQEEKPVLVAYSSTSADKPQLLNAFGRLGIPTTEIEEAFFDLYYDCINTQKVQTQVVFLPMRGSMNLKDVTAFLGYKEPSDLKISSGLDALITYEKYLRTKKESLKLDLLRYNKVDLERTKYVFDKIRGSF